MFNLKVARAMILILGLLLGIGGSLHQAHSGKEYCHDTTDCTVDDVCRDDGMMCKASHGRLRHTQQGQYKAVGMTQCGDFYTTRSRPCDVVERGTCGGWRAYYRPDLCL